MQKKSFLPVIFLVFLLLGSVGCAVQIENKIGLTEQLESTHPVNGIESTLVSITPTATLTAVPTQELPNTPVVVTIVPSETTQTSQICTPLAGHSIEDLLDIVSDPYNPPPLGKDGRHMGVDFSYYPREGRNGIAGVPVQAMLPGKVVGVFDNQIPYGFAVMIETKLDQLPAEWFENIEQSLHPTSLYSLYAHLQEFPELAFDASVYCGEQIGRVGSTGGVGTPYAIPHLHLEMRFGPPDARFEEMGFYDTRISETARQNYLTWRTSGSFTHFDPLIFINNYLNHQ